LRIKRRERLVDRADIIGNALGIAEKRLRLRNRRTQRCQRRIRQARKIFRVVDEGGSFVFQTLDLIVDLLQRPRSR
jgi:hypothetical protein